jgi:small-conductance mechanosensitive channel
MSGGSGRGSPETGEVGVRQREHGDDSVIPRTADEDDRDLGQAIGDEITVTLDRWSAGQIGVTDLLTAVGILAVGAAIAWLTSRLMRRYARRLSGAASAAMASVGLLLATGVVLVSVALALEVLGFSLGPILVMIMIAVVLLLLARPLVTNLSSGLLLQLRAALEAGDLVATNGVRGVVQEVNARSVVIETSDGRRVHVPNHDVAAQKITNYTTVGRRRSNLDFTVDHQVDLGATLDLVTDAVAREASVLDEPAPHAQLAGILGRFVVVRVLIWHPSSNAAERHAVSDATRATVGACREAGIELDGPHLIWPGEHREAVDDEADHRE